MQGIKSGYQKRTENMLIIAFTMNTAKLLGSNCQSVLVSAEQHSGSNELTNEKSCSTEPEQKTVVCNR